MLTVEDVYELIKAGKPEWIKEAYEEHEKLETHINGDDVDECLTPLEGWENQHQFKARKELATSNRYIFETITRPIDKVFSATGGNNVYPKNSDKLLKAISNVRHGFSLKQWIKNVQSNKYYTDPNGLVFFEWTREKCYPTIKSISSLLNYCSDGRLVEWVIFEPKIKDDGKYYRVVDESFDYTYKLVGEKLQLIEDKTFPNPFGRCPAIINSDIIHFELNRKDSPFAPIVELADHFLRTGTNSNIAENYHGYPIFWAYGQPCKRCHGEGSINVNNVIETCPSCDGKGNSLKKDVTDVINLRPPESDGAKLAPDVAGYVVPPISSLQELRKILDELKQAMFYTIWGTSYDRNQETATATFIDAQPVNERLSRFSESFEDMEQKMTEILALYYLGSANNISINWGKRFILESPDAIWNKYINAKTKGAPRTALNYLLSQFYQSEYSNDTESLIASLKLIKLEPFIHLTEKEVRDNGITGEDLTAKMYFNEWVWSLADGYIFITDVKKLKTEFASYIKDKSAKIEGAYM